MKTIELNVLRKLVSEAPVGGTRLNDLAKGSKMKIKAITQDGEGDDMVTNVTFQIHKDDVATKTVRVTLFGFATMRLTDLTGDALAALKTTQDTRDSNDVFSVQDAWNESEEKISKEKTFEVVAVVTIPNNYSKENGAVVLRDNCYEGFREFSAQNAAIWNNDEKSQDEKLQERNALRNIMLSTPVREGMNIEKNQVTVPVFTVRTA